MFEGRYADVWAGPRQWQDIKVTESETYSWNGKSTYVQNPPYFEKITEGLRGFSDIMGSRPLAILGDSVTTDHISPAGSIKADSPAGRYLTENGSVKPTLTVMGLVAEITR